jgi:hypothetical protein
VFRIILSFAALLCLVGCQRTGTGSQVVAAFWFADVTPASIAVVNERLTAPLTPAELATIESVARNELHLAFANTRLQFTTSLPAIFRVRVVPAVARRSIAAAGESRSFGGIRGDGVVNFNIVAISAVAYAADPTDREKVLHAIGRGIGRTAVHEFAHQILGPAAMDGTADRLSYEHADLRPEHFYGTLHWGPAASTLQARIGLADRAR